MLTVYDPKEVTFSFKGLNVTGFMDGTFIEIEHNEDAFTSHAGATGDVTRTINRDLRGKITITLMAASPANTVLSQLHQMDRVTNDGWGAAMAKDLSGTSKCRAAQAWIMKAPKWERAKESGSCVWVFECAELSIEPEGNTVVE